MSTFHDAQTQVNRSLKDAWKWAKAGSTPEVRRDRWKALWKVAKHRAKHSQKRAAWAGRRVIYRRHFRKQKAAVAAGRKPEFATYMANGCPYAGLSDTLKQVIAWAVVDFDQYITATTNGVHATGSFHYIWRAVDGGGPMTTAGIASMRRFQEFLGKAFPGSPELFGPAPWYIKNGQRFAGVFPGHGNHWHKAA